MNGTLDVGNSYDTARLTVTNGMTLNGTALVGNPTNSWYGGINFAGSQTLGGNGTVIFGNQSNPGYNALWLSVAGSTLTIGSGISINGINGTIGYSSAYGGPQNVNVVNQGALDSVDGGTLNVSATLTNNGTFYSTNSSVTLGGTVTLANLGSFNPTNTKVYLTGTYINTNGNLSVNGWGRQTWYLQNGGYILGGVVNGDQRFIAHCQQRHIGWSGRQWNIGRGQHRGRSGLDRDQWADTQRHGVGWQSDR